MLDYVNVVIFLCKCIRKLENLPNAFFLSKAENMTFYQTEQSKTLNRIIGANVYIDCPKV